MSQLNTATRQRLTTAKTKATKQLNLLAGAIEDSNKFADGFEYPPDLQQRSEYILSKKIQVNSTIKAINEQVEMVMNLADEGSAIIEANKLAESEEDVKFMGQYLQHLKDRKKKKYSK